MAKICRPQATRASAWAFRLGRPLGQATDKDLQAITHCLRLQRCIVGSTTLQYVYLYTICIYTNTIQYTTIQYTTIQYITSHYIITMYNYD
jgi:hypothetical protein